MSVLEGGYSDRALTSGAMAHLCGLVDDGSGQLAGSVKEEWWNVDNLIKVRFQFQSTSKAGLKNSGWF